MRSKTALDSTRYFTAAETARANMDMPGSSLDDRRYALDVWFPLAIAAYMGVADSDAKRYALAAILTFSQLLHLLTACIIGQRPPS